MHKRSNFSRGIYVSFRCDFGLDIGHCNKNGIFVDSESSVLRAIHPEQNDLV